MEDEKDGGWVGRPPPPPSSPSPSSVSSQSLSVLHLRGSAAWRWPSRRRSHMRSLPFLLRETQIGLKKPNWGPKPVGGPENDPMDDRWKPDGNLTDGNPMEDRWKRALA